ncbi:MAG TPA: hypothetical protein PKN08_12820 [Opitutaceae bacterium]|jgi:hypothetical protein|nr:hypothetical protein [Opitutaceae bacterium]
MKKLSLCLVLVSGLALLSGCESLNDATEDMRENLGVRNDPETHLVAAEPRAVYAAGRAAAEDMGFSFRRGGPAQGELEAISGIASDDSLRSTTQRRMKVRFVAHPYGTEIRFWLTEVREEESSSNRGLSTERALRHSSLASVFFQSVDTRLGIKPETK